MFPGNWRKREKFSLLFAVMNEAYVRNEKLSSLSTLKLNFHSYCSQKLNFSYVFLLYAFNIQHEQQQQQPNIFQSFKTFAKTQNAQWKFITFDVFTFLRNILLFFWSITTHTHTRAIYLEWKITFPPTNISPFFFVCVFFIHQTNNNNNNLQRLCLSNIVTHFHHHHHQQHHQHREHKGF